MSNEKCTHKVKLSELLKLAGSLKEWPQQKVKNSMSILFYEIRWVRKMMRPQQGNPRLIFRLFKSYARQALHKTK